MKKLICLFTVAVLVSSFCFGCAVNNNNSSSENDVSVENDSSGLLSETLSNGNNETGEESRIPPEEIYPFLKSEYKVTSSMTSFEKVYVCEYYFVDGIVVGAKLMTTLGTEDAAYEYYKSVIEEFEDASLNGCTVTHYLDDDDNFYYGYSLEKLKFVLERTGYTIGINFNENEFNDKYNKQKTID